MPVGRVAVSCLHAKSIPQQETATRPAGNGNLVAIERTPLRGCTLRLLIVSVPGHPVAAARETGMRRQHTTTHYPQLKVPPRLI